MQISFNRFMRKFSREWVKEFRRVKVLIVPTARTSLRIYPGHTYQLVRVSKLTLTLMDTESEDTFSWYCDRDDSGPEIVGVSIQKRLGNASIRILTGGRFTRDS